MCSCGDVRKETKQTNHTRRIQAGTQGPGGLRWVAPRRAREPAPRRIGGREGGARKKSARNRPSPKGTRAGTGRQELQTTPFPGRHRGGNAQGDDERKRSAAQRCNCNARGAAAAAAAAAPEMVQCIALRFTSKQCKRLPLPLLLLRMQRRREQAGDPDAARTPIRARATRGES